MFNNIPQVTKNLLIINILVFLATLYFQTKGMDLNAILGAHYVNSPLFQPFQVVTHFFAHDGFFHLFFNMWMFVILGGYLERRWGAKRFFNFYLLCGLGAFGLYNIIGVYEIEMLKNSLDNVHYSINGIDYLLNLNDINDTLREGKYSPFFLENIPAYEEYVNKSLTPMVGASGAVFGVMAAFALLLPNAEFMLYFAIPVKAKYLVGAYFLFEVYMAFQNQQGDNVAHLAHVGGAIVGAIMVFIWRKTDRTNFY